LWIYKGKKDDDLLKMYLDAMESVNSKLIAKSPNGLVYAGEYNNGLQPKMGHLACFVGGLYSLTATHVDTLSEEKREYYQTLAKDITNTCHESYIRTPTHLGKN
jgi:mannosyl-oligosaccharide alpha-1,2-mannosidase